MERSHIGKIGSKRVTLAPAYVLHQYPYRDTSRIVEVGRALATSNARDLPAIAQRIGLELRNQYLLAYSPANQSRDGKYRRVQVNLLPPPALPPLKARWRLGYYAPSQ